MLPGLQVGRKWSTLYTEIPAGEATGNLEVRPNSMVIPSSMTHRQGHGVVYVDADGKQQRQKARVVAVMATRSKVRGFAYQRSAKFPNGLANSSGQVAAPHAAPDR